METILTILDKILLYLLSKIYGETFNEKIENVRFIFLFSGVSLFFSGAVLTLAPLFIGTTLMLSGTANGDSLSIIDSFSKSGLVQFLTNIVIAGICLIILGFLIEKRLKKIIKEHAFVESSEIEEQS